MFLIREAIEAKFEAEIQVVSDGEKAVHFFEQIDANDGAVCPDLVILDLNLPRKKGGEVLSFIRNSRRCKEALVIVVTSSNVPREREEMRQHGANAYFRKPSEYAEYMKLGDVLRDLLQT